MLLSIANIVLPVLLWWGVALYLKRRLVTRDERVRDYLERTLHRRGPAGTDGAELKQDAHRRWLGPLIRLGSAVTLFNAAQRRQLNRSLVRAGWRMPAALPLLIVCKLGCGAGLALLSLLYTLPDAYGTLFARSLPLLGCFVAGMIVPEYLLRVRIARRQSVIEHALPDALDLLVICTNAGFSLGVSLERVATELAGLCPALADELDVCVGELRLSGDSAVVLRALAERIGTMSARSLVMTLQQSQQYGTPITQALRQLARSERAARMLRLEEKAAKLATKITLPMMIFILPAVLIIAGGPAIMHLKTALLGH